MFEVKNEIWTNPAKVEEELLMIWKGGWSRQVQVGLECAYCGGRYHLMWDAIPWVYHSYYIGQLHGQGVCAWVVKH